MELPQSPPGRRLLALALVPLLPPFYGLIFFGNPWSLPMGLLVSYPSAFVCGWPLLGLLARRGERRPLPFALAGVVCAQPALLLYAFWPALPHLPPFSLETAAGLLGWGAAGGVLVWALAVNGPPLRLRHLLDAGPPG